jgi:hypothetical protein
MALAITNESSAGDEHGVGRRPRENLSPLPAPTAHGCEVADVRVADVGPDANLGFGI